MENDDILSDAEWQRNLNSVNGKLHGLLAETGLRYFESEDEITTDGGADYALPSDYLSTIGVDYKADASGTRWELSEVMVQQRNLFSGSSASSGQARGWATVGQNLILYPTPPSGQTYYHVYVPHATDISAVATSTSVDVVTPDGEQFIRWSLVVLAKAKEESDARLAMAERDAAEQRFREWAVLRALNSNRRVMLANDDGIYHDPGDWWPRGNW